MSRYYILDTPMLLRSLFFPEEDYTPGPKNSFDLMVPVDKEREIAVSCRFYMENKDWPWILYFHGNGEVVSDYDHIAPLYHREKLNLVVSDYRGYGASSGRPTFAGLIKDAHFVLKSVKKELSDREYPDNLFLMGRSMGSIPALELARHYPKDLKGLIIESGFVCATRLVKHLRLPSSGLNLEALEEECVAKAREITLPTLIVHGEYDNLVPLQEARDLLTYLGSTQKELLIIPGADHNNVMFIDEQQYFQALSKFCYSLK